MTQFSLEADNADEPIGYMRAWRASDWEIESVAVTVETKD